MMTADDLQDDDHLLPGDVVVDENTHRPMQVTGFDLRQAKQVDAVWNSNVNQHYHDIQPDDEVMELIGLPTGRRYFVPEDVERFPSIRLKRILTESATGDRRVQEKVVRSVLAHLVADARQQGNEELAQSMLSLMGRHFDDALLGEIDEFANSMSPLDGGQDG